MPEAKTIKQAKAAYKTRTEQPLTEREQKQLERSVQLDRRAWGIREREKTKVDLAKKRAAQEKAQRDEDRRLGTQRRFDKHGFKSSQFHLGAFFQRPGPVARPGGTDVKTAVVEPAAPSEPDEGKTEENATKEDTEDEFGDDDDEFDDVDDESLLEALQSPEAVRTARTYDTPAKPDTRMPPPPRPKPVQSHIQQVPEEHQPADQDLDWFDEFESSTQIAREIGTETSTIASPLPRTPAARELVRSTSFSSGSFDLTEDDIEQLDPTPRAHTNDEHHTKHEQIKASAERISMPPPPLPLTRARPQPAVPRKASETNAISNSTHALAKESLGFSMTQLESFMEEDLELTQT